MKQNYDDQLLDTINFLKNDWDQAVQTEQAVSETDNHLFAQTMLTKQKYMFMYRQARKRNIKNDRIQPSVYEN
ncbi:YaaL family protein [Fructilactobacillus fructivorans]|nr:YaaL family protein [Fructilactobacillus fructivorans]KRK57713.1 hypothetical protein FC73_GL000721 [Fructilactobacillus fructivorans]KRN12745.1 hypothetical protein IV37_GL001047 [Fructilactobacillus fructivorans]KRN40591.1 hypothetical protein IV51_GL001212 [Fructilactobacillus fructivorans]KRN43132.1 hypothetical protein IV48_GL000687 [Fructilactobacillus fructivorans]